MDDTARLLAVEVLLADPREARQRRPRNRPLHPARPALGRVRCCEISQSGVGLAGLGLAARVGSLRGQSRHSQGFGVLFDLTHLGDSVPMAARLEKTSPG